ncbi:unnamed protein product [Amoebophrya sp. A25]|nr:unnamed protein product [Amoebophrya sp. A25]|eukprot:GSA25T00012061001.1
MSSHKKSALVPGPLLWSLVTVSVLDCVMALSMRSSLTSTSGVTGFSSSLQYSQIPPEWATHPQFSNRQHPPQGNLGAQPSPVPVDAPASSQHQHRTRQHVEQHQTSHQQTSQQQQQHAFAHEHGSQAQPNFPRQQQEPAFWEGQEVTFDATYGGKITAHIRGRVVQADPSEDTLVIQLLDQKNKLIHSVPKTVVQPVPKSIVQPHLEIDVQHATRDLKHALQLSNIVHPSPPNGVGMAGDTKARTESDSTNNVRPRPVGNIVSPLETNPIPPLATNQQIPPPSVVHPHQITTPHQITVPSVQPNPSPSEVVAMTQQGAPQEAADPAQQVQQADAMIQQKDAQQETTRPQQGQAEPPQAELPSENRHHKKKKKEMRADAAIWKPPPMLAKAFAAERVNRHGSTSSAASSSGAEEPSMNAFALEYYPPPHVVACVEEQRAAHAAAEMGSWTGVGESQGEDAYNAYSQHLVHLGDHHHSEVYEGAHAYHGLDGSACGPMDSFSFYVGSMPGELQQQEYEAFAATTEAQQEQVQQVLVHQHYCNYNTAEAAGGEGSHGAYEVKPSDFCIDMHELQTAQTEEGDGADASSSIACRHNYAHGFYDTLGSAWTHQEEDQQHYASNQYEQQGAQRGQADRLQHGRNDEQEILDDYQQHLYYGFPGRAENVLPAGTSQEAPRTLLSKLKISNQRPLPKPFAAMEAIAARVAHVAENGTRPLDEQGAVCPVMKAAGNECARNIVRMRVEYEQRVKQADERKRVEAAAAAAADERKRSRRPRGPVEMETKAVEIHGEMYFLQVPKEENNKDNIAAETSTRGNVESTLALATTRTIPPNVVDTTSSSPATIGMIPTPISPEQTSVDNAYSGLQIDTGVTQTIAHRLNSPSADVPTPSSTSQISPSPCNLQLPAQPPPGIAVAGTGGIPIISNPQDAGHLSPGLVSQSPVHIILPHLHPPRLSNLGPHFFPNCSPPAPGCWHQHQQNSFGTLPALGPVNSVALPPGHQCSCGVGGASPNPVSSLAAAAGSLSATFSSVPASGSPQMVILPPGAMPVMFVSPNAANNVQSLLKDGSSSPVYCREGLSLDRVPRA